VCISAPIFKEIVPETLVIKSNTNDGNPNLISDTRKTPNFLEQGRSENFFKEGAELVQSLKNWEFFVTGAAKRMHLFSG